jgi:hypothetical protein
MELGFILPVEGVDAAALARWLAGEQKLGCDRSNLPAGYEVMRLCRL